MFAVIIAGMFHSSAYIMLGMIFIVKAIPSIKKILIVEFIGVVTGILYQRILPFFSGTEYGIYQGSSSFFYGMSWIRVAFWCLQYLFSIWFMLKIVNKNTNKVTVNRILIWAMTLSQALYLASLQYVLFSRIEYYVSILGAIGISTFPKAFTKRSQAIAISLFSLIYILYCIYATQTLCAYRTFLDVI